MKILFLLLKNIVSLSITHRRLFSFKIFSFFALFRAKGNVSVSQQILPAHSSTLLTNLNDVWSSVCLDLDTYKVSTNHVYCNHLKESFKGLTGKLRDFSHYNHLYVLFCPLQCASLLKCALNVNYYFRRSTLSRGSDMLLWCEKYLVLLAVFFILLNVFLGNNFNRKVFKLFV